MARLGRLAPLSFLLLLLTVDAASLKAQTESRQRLHVLRIEPAGLAEPTDSVIVTFDRPVAPRLDRSVDPAQALRLSPAAVSSSYWRDPSTVVVVFERPWAFGAEYRVDLVPTLRSADGHRLAAGQGRTVRVRPPRSLALWPSHRADGEVATMQRPRVVYEAPVPLLSLVGRSWLVPYGCGWGRDSIPLRPESIAMLDTSDVQQLGAPGRDADPMLDSLRRVVSFVAERELPRACSFVVSLASGSAGVDRRGRQALYRTAPEFRLDSVAVSSQYSLDGHVALHFNLPVSQAEVRRAVRVNGHAVTTAPSPSNAYRPDTAARTQWLLTDSLAPGQRAEIVVQGDLHDVAGEALGAETRRTLERPHARPMVSQLSGLVVVAKDAGVLLVASHVNVDSVAIDMARVPDSMRVAMLRRNRWGSAQDWGRSRGGIVTRTIAVTSTLDSTGTVSIPDTLLPPEWRDDELIAVRARGIPGATYQRISRWALPPFVDAIVQRTNLAAHVTTYMGRGEIWVTSLRTGDPVSGARVRVLDSNGVVLAGATTDARGRARIDFHEADSPWAESPLVEVTSGREHVMLVIDGMPRERIVDDDVGGSRNASSPRVIHGGTQLHGAAFSERGIYRPGERVFLKGVVRTFEPYGNFRTPASDSVRWTIHHLGDADSYRWRDRPEQVQRHGVVLTSFGTAVDTFEIPRAAPLGQYSATLALKTDEGWRTAATALFSVAEYRAVEFNLTLDADSTITLFAGDTAHLRARARYLFGMPMTGATVTWGGYTDETVPSIIGLRAVDGWRVGRSWWRLPVAYTPMLYITPASVELDAGGIAAIDVPASTAWPTGRMHLIVTATDANRRTVTAERSLTVHAADAYVAMRTRSSRWYWNAGDTIAVDLTVARVNGERRAGTDVDLTALRYAWRDREWRADTVWRGKARSSSAPVSTVFTPSEAGWYELLATAHDERGRATTTGLDLWVTGPRRTPRTEERRDVKITLDRERYAPGDTITAVLDSPLELRAWVSLSRSVPLNEQMVLLHPGPNVVKVHVPMEAIPSAELRVVGVSPLGLGVREHEKFLFTAFSTIQVSSRSRELAVRVSSDRSSYAPGDSVRVHVQIAAPGGRGARAETTIWAVDQGVGLLTGLEKPDLLGTLLGSRVLSPSQRSTLDAYVLGLAPIPAMLQVRIRGMSSAGRDITGSMSSVMLEENVVTTAYSEQRADAPLRRRFATTPLFAGSVVTDSAGAAEVRFRLPDNVTTYRLFATAVTAGMEAGSGDTSLVSTRPLVVRAALPRAVRLGDSLVAGGVLTQDADGVTPVSLHVETRGIDVRGAATRSDTLRGRTARELRFPMRVASGDSVTVRLRGGSAAVADAVELTLPVSPAGRPRAHVVSGSMEGRVDVSLPAIEGIDVGRSSVSVQLGTSVQPLVRQLSDALRAYPYGCTEQLASAGRALLARLALARVKEPAATLDVNDRRTLESIVSRIVARQQLEGGFGYWERDGWTSPWLTAYATELLIDARTEGVRVAEPVTTDAANYLERAIPDDATLQVWTNRIWPAPSSHDLVASARVLRRLGRPSARLETALSRMRDRLPFVDGLELARLRAMAGDSTEARRLLDVAWSAAHTSGRKVALDDSTRSGGWLFESRLRAIATLTKATGELEPKHPLLGALLESLIQRGRAERDWQWNTLDQSATAEALAAVRSLYGFGETRHVDVTGPSGKLATSTFEAGRSDSLGVSLAALMPSAARESTPRLRLVANTRAPIYYAATLFETPRARPVRADDEGISLERWYEGYDDGKPTMSVREGQLVRVRLRVTVKGSREFVAVEDPLPAGLEAVDLNLRTSAALEPPAWARRAATSNGRQANRRSWAWWSPWEHTEMRDDRVLYFARTLGRGSWDITYVARATTAGVFVRPPAQAEEMYNPAVHGRSDGGWFTVTEAR